MNHAPDKKQLITLAEECISRGHEKRPEIHWLENRYNDLQKKHQLKRKTDTDNLIFRKMYGTEPLNSSDTTKIRFWRTGHHLPITREECISFGHALELNDTDMDVLLLDYFDSCRIVYEQPSDCNPQNYQKKCDTLEALVSDYLAEFPDTMLKQYSIPSDNRRPFLRHLYFVDAFCHISSSNNSAMNTVILEKHICSANYATELARSLQLLGTIPRKTMLRHLLLFGKSHLTLDWINQMLELLEYRPLREEHTLVTGEHLDWLLIQLIRLYEEYRASHSPEESLDWFREACCILDQYFVSQKENRLRFLYFKSLRYNT